MSVGVALLGSTGSIGRSTIRVMERHPDRFHPVAFTAHTSTDALVELGSRFGDVFLGASGCDGNAPAGVVAGEQALVEAATHPDAEIIVNAVVGAAGLRATVAALEAGKRVALANKESLVMGGELVLEAARRGGGELVPVDSEHSAILQCVAGSEKCIRSLVLTASGGPFRDWKSEDVVNATVDDALNHPTWNMGRKITVDSASLANKALEVIETHFLFGLGYDEIRVVVHPQSIIHAFAEFIDGSILAQVGFPDMELPILYALTYPERVNDTGVKRFDPVEAASLTFEAVRTDVFPALDLGYSAGRQGGTMPAVFNAANEVAVAAFLDGQIGFGRIPEVIEGVMGRVLFEQNGSLETVLNADSEARAKAEELCC